MRSDFTQTLYASIASRGAAPFWVSRERSYSYADLQQAICQFCGAFDVAGAAEGDAVQIVTDDGWIATVAFLAALLDHKRPMVQAPDAGLARLSGISNRVKPVVKFVDFAISGGEWTENAFICGEESAARAAADRDAGHRVLADLLPTVTGRDPSCSSAADDTAYLLFTSGTTDLPKGVEVTVKGIARQLDDIARVFEVKPESRIFNGLVIYHADGLIQGPLLAAFAGCTVLRPGRFAIERLEKDLEWMVAQGGTHMIAAPVICSLIEKHAAGTHYFDRPEFHAVLSSSAPLDRGLWERFEARFNTHIVNEYGMTETVAASHFAGPHPEMGAKYTIGKPIGCEASVQDEEGNILPQGVRGELCMRGDIVLSRYFQDPARTEAAFRNGWFRTGDLAEVQPDGSYVLVGRLNTVINSGGFNIQPEEIDEALLRHEAVEAAATVGLPHPEFGEMAVSAVKLRSDASVNTLVDHCRKHLESWKQPRRIVIVDDVPRTASGKVERGKLSEMLTGALEITVDATEEVTDRLLTLAALVFSVEKADISIEDGPDEIESWDSFTHMTFALELEKTFDIKLKPHDLVELETLAEFRDVIRERS